jgi:hypothetical protein
MTVQFWESTSRRFFLAHQTWRCSLARISDPKTIDLWFLLGSRYRGLIICKEKDAMLQNQQENSRLWAKVVAKAWADESYKS